MECPQQYFHSNSTIFPSLPLQIPFDSKKECAGLGALSLQELKRFRHNLRSVWVCVFFGLQITFHFSDNTSMIRTITIQIIQHYDLWLYRICPLCAIPNLRGKKCIQYSHQTLNIVLKHNFKLKCLPKILLYLFSKGSPKTVMRNKLSRGFLSGFFCFSVAGAWKRYQSLVIME